MGVNSLGLTEPIRDWRVGMTDRRGEERRDEEREKTRRQQEDDVRRQEDSARRSDELREAWRRHHPREPEEGGEAERV